MKISEEEKRTLQLFKILGNSTRYMIIKILGSGRKNVSTLEKLTGKAQTVISLHLRLLRDLDIVSFETIGKNVYYSLKKKNIIDLIELGYKIMQREKDK